MELRAGRRAGSHRTFRGSHRTFRYENEDTGEVRTVTVPLHGELKTGTLREIADQAGANDFDVFCRELEQWL